MASGRRRANRQVSCASATAGAVLHLHRHRPCHLRPHDHKQLQCGIASTHGSAPKPVLASSGENSGVPHRPKPRQEGEGNQALRSFPGASSYMQARAAEAVQVKWKEIRDALEGLDDVMPMAFLLRKDTRSRHLHSFKLRPIGNKTKLHNKLRRKIKGRLEGMADEKRPIKNFDKDYESDSITIMDVKKSSFVDETLKTILQMADTDPIDSLKSMQTAKYSATLFRMPDHGSIITIDSVAVYHEGFKKVGHLLSYDDDVSDVDGMIMFKFDLPCIYFEKFGMLLVLDRKATEQIFNLIEHYQDRIKDYFEDLADDDRIDINLDDLKEWTKTMTMARRVNAMIQNGMLDRDIDVYERYRDYLDSHSDIDDDGLLLKLDNGTISIPDKKHFESFLNFSETNLQQSVIDPNDTYVTSRKRKVVRKTA